MNIEFLRFKIPNVSNLLFTISRNRNEKLPYRLLCSSEYGFFWHYGSTQPPFLLDNSDYDLSERIEFLDYIFLQNTTINDPEIINWKDISYSLEQVKQFFTIPVEEYIIPDFKKEFSAGKRKVLFANGEYGMVVNFVLNNSHFSVKLFNSEKNPNIGGSNLAQNYKDGKHTSFENTKLQWQVIHVV